MYWFDCFDWRLLFGLYRVLGSMAYSRDGRADGDCKQAAVGVIAAVCDGVVGFACPCELQKQDDKVHGCERLKYACSCESSPAMWNLSRLHVCAC